MAWSKSLWKLVNGVLKPVVDTWTLLISGGITFGGSCQLGDTSADTVSVLGTSDFQAPVVIDVTNAEALLIRANADGGDFLAIDTTALRALLTQNGIGALSAAYDATGTGLILANETPSTVGTPVQTSPALRFRGRAWDIDGAADKKLEWRLVMSNTSANNPISSMLLQYSIDGAAWVTKATFASTGNLTMSGTLSSTGAVYVGSALVESTESFLATIGGTTTQALTPGKGVSLVSSISTAGTNIVALTLADGTTEGQRKALSIGDVAAGTVFVLTPATTFGAWTTITWTGSIGGGCELIWTATGWGILGNEGGVVA